MRWETLLTHPAVQALGRALLHFLWQGSLLALLLWVVKAMAPPGARVRYAAASLIMPTMPVALVVTVAQDFRNESAVRIEPMALSHAHAPAELSREAAVMAEWGTSGGRDHNEHDGPGAKFFRHTGPARRRQDRNHWKVSRPFDVYPG